MEQYWMPKEQDFVNLRKCIDKYDVDSLYIRQVASHGGEIQHSEDITGRSLDFCKDDTGLYILADGVSLAFHFPLKNYQKGFSLAYERIFDDGRMYFHGGIADEPYDPSIPEPKRSYLRTVLDDHLMEIFFKGRVDIEFHSWWNKPHWKYWAVK